MSVPKTHRGGYPSKEFGTVRSAHAIHIAPRGHGKTKAMAEAIDRYAQYERGDDTLSSIIGSGDFGPSPIEQIRARLATDTVMKQEWALLRKIGIDLDESAEALSKLAGVSKTTAREALVATLERIIGHRPRRPLLRSCREGLKLALAEADE